MKIKREIIILSFVATLICLSIFYYGLELWQKELKQQPQDLYTWVAPNPTALVQINRPELFTEQILNNPNEQAIFARHIPPVFLSLIEKGKDLPHLLLSVHPQGVVLYMHPDVHKEERIEELIRSILGNYKPHVQKRADATYTFYPDTADRYLGIVRQKELWAASYSKQLLEQVTIQYNVQREQLSAIQQNIRHQFDPNVPLNIMLQANPLDLYVSISDSIEWRILDWWIGADLFIDKDQNLCYFGSLPYTESADSLYAPMGDTLAIRLQTLFPGFQVTCETTHEEERVFYTGSLNPTE